ncbi:MAG TPA: hypothetical protein VMB50_00545 [Myxococcales bacterium]|nr:hypothetical protein [Myxococcales bacterium]
MRHALIVVGCFSLAACSGTGSGGPKACGTANESCVTSADCCANYLCSASLCLFVGGNNGNGNGNGSNGAGTSTGGCGLFGCHGSSGGDASSGGNTAGNSTAGGNTGGSGAATTTGGTGGACGVVGDGCSLLAPCCSGLDCSSGSCVEPSGTSGGLCGGTACNFGEACVGGNCACDSDCTSANGYSCNGADRCIQGQCVQGGSACTLYSDCCSGDCAQQVCSSCSGQGGSCPNGSGCCVGLTCYDDVCGICQQDGTACTGPAQCCSDICDQGTCEACHDDGTSCGSNTDCCSGLCQSGTCQISTADLCAPCTSDSNCSPGNYCVAFTPDFCAPACSTTCPTGMVCIDAPDTSGLDHPVCIPSSEACTSTTGGTTGGGSTGGSTTGGKGGTTGGSTGCTETTIDTTEFASCPGTACGPGLSCATDPWFGGTYCEYPCTTTANCPDTLTVCVSGTCTENACGSGSPSGDSNVSVANNAKCNAEGTGDGTCFAFVDPDAGYLGSVCIQGGSAAAGAACGAITRCGGQTTTLCAAGEDCLNDGTSNVCYTTCSSAGAACSNGQTCANLDGYNDYCP